MIYLTSSQYFRQYLAVNRKQEKLVSAVNSKVEESRGQVNPTSVGV